MTDIAHNVATETNGGAELSRSLKSRHVSMIAMVRVYSLVLRPPSAKPVLPLYSPLPLPGSLSCWSCG
jgi:hypothetical protein